MDANKLREDVLRAEGYAEGFKNGYIACANNIAKQLADEEAKKKSEEEVK